jgi:hypothetical protein
VDYYVQAADHSGRAEGMPRVAPAAWYTFPIEPAATGADAVAGAEAGAASAYPNPFRESTRFAFELRFPGRVRLDVIDVAGRRVRALEDGVRGGGSHAIEWDGRDESGRPVAAGVYFFRLRAAGISYTRPVVRGSSG